jgi:hypothetical protein
VERAQAAEAEADVIERLGNVIYWLGTMMAIGWFALFASIFGLSYQAAVGIIFWLMGWIVRYILTGQTVSTPSQH